MIGRRSHDDAQSFDEAWSGRTPRDEHIAELVRFAETLCEAAVAEPTAEFRAVAAHPADDRGRDGPRPPVAVQGPHHRHRRAARPRTPPHRRPHCCRSSPPPASSAWSPPAPPRFPARCSTPSSAASSPSSSPFTGRRLAWLLPAGPGLRAPRRGSRAQRQPVIAYDALIASTLEDFSSQAQHGSSTLFDDFDNNGKTKSIQKVNDFAAAAAADLATLSAPLPDDADDAFASSGQDHQRSRRRGIVAVLPCASADVQSLVSAVTALTAGHRRPTTRKPADERRQADDRPQPTTRPAPPAARRQAPAPDHCRQVTVPPIDPSPAVTDPLIDGLLGEEGLVPGLAQRPARQSEARWDTHQGS